jgi:RNA polymerase sigma factor (sigma-70 family)
MSEIGATAIPSPRAIPLRGARRRTGEGLVVEILREHAGGLLALARRHSLCADDAHDAYQRATEIFLRRADSLEPATAAGWLRTVVKHEAMAVRASRQAAVSRDEPDLDLQVADALPSAEERAAAFERLAHAAEALGRLKPQETRALLLRAEGHSYEEICAITGWTYTKVNRCLTEGRRAFRLRVAGIEAGAECERWAPVLSAVADGEATQAQLVAVRPHLRACPACRATVREFHAAPGRVAALVPVAALAGPLAAGVARGPGPAVSSALHRLHEALGGAAPSRVQAMVDLATGGKAVAIAASTVALAGGTFVVGRDVRRAVAPQAVPVRRAAERPRRAEAAPRPAPVSVGSPVRAMVATPAAAPSAAAIHAARVARIRHAAKVAAAHATAGEGEFGPAGGSPVSSSSSATAPRASAASVAPAPAAPAAPAPAAAGPHAASASGGTSEFGP